LNEALAVKLASEEVDLIAMSGVELTVEGGAPLRPGTERAVEVSGDNFGPRLRGRVLACEVVGLGATGPRYRIALILNRPPDVAPPPVQTVYSPFEFGNIELGEPDPALAANSW
jgi:hypothetical protein